MTRFGIGESVRRIEDPRFVRGHGRFVDDIHLPQQGFGVVLMSSHAHAVRHDEVRTIIPLAGIGRKGARTTG